MASASARGSAASIRSMPRVAAGRSPRSGPSRRQPSVTGAGRSASDLAVASAWRDRCYEAFLGGYVAAGGPDSAAHEALLTAYLIDKAAYEALYEYRNRPDWIGIPLAALRGLAGL